MDYVSLENKLKDSFNKFTELIKEDCLEDLR